MQVVPFDETQYYAEWNEGDDVTRYRVYGSPVSGATILNVHELKAEQKGSSWVFIRYRIEATEDLRLWVVRKESVKGQSEAEELDFIRKHAVEDQLYEPFALCKRTK